MITAHPPKDWQRLPAAATSSNSDLAGARSLQMPLIISEDAQQIIDRVKNIYGGRIPMSELQTCWRPPSPRVSPRPWPNKRFWSAVDEAINSGAIKRVDGFCGAILVMEDHF